MPHMMDVEASDVVRIILQFCKENSLFQSYAAIEQECQTSLNTVDSVDEFVTEVHEGRWDLVLPAVARLGLPRQKVEDLYEHVAIELAESREVEAGRALLRQTAAMIRLSKEQPVRYARLAHMFAQPNGFDAKEAFPDSSSRKIRREALARTLACELVEARPSRLLVLLNQALKWQRQQGQVLPSKDIPLEVNLFGGTAPVDCEEEEICHTEAHCVIKFGKKNHAESAVFSPDGASIATSSADGFIELYDCNTGKLREDLQYQAEGMSMMHDDAVLALDFSADGKVLVSGSQDGKIKVWRISSGQCLRKFDRAHRAGITSVCLSLDGYQVLSASLDGTARVHGLKSGKMLKELRGHSSYVNDARYTMDGLRILTASSDGIIRVWDSKSGERVREIQLLQTGSVVSSGANAAVLRVVPLAIDPKSFVVCPKGSVVHIMTTSGDVIRTFCGEVSDVRGLFVTCAVSPNEQSIYALGADGTVHCFSVDSGARVKLLRAHEGDAIGLCHHPKRNVIATFAKQGSLRVWKPR